MNMKLSAHVITMLLAAASVASYAAEPEKPPVYTRIDLIQKAEPTVLLVRVEKPNNYAVWLKFNYRETPDENSRIYELLGGARKNDLGKWEEPGVPATFRVSINKHGNLQPILQEEVQAVHTNAGYKARWAALVSARLEPGDYQVSVGIASAIAQLRPITTEVVFAPAHHGK